MKKSFSIMVVVSLMLGLAAVASADTPAPGGPFATAFRVQNLGTLEATCQYSLYSSTGTAAFTSTATSIDPGDSMFVYTPDLTMSSGAYSGVVSCDQPVAAVVNFSDADSGASHSGISSDGLSTTWYAPGIYDNFFNFYSNIVVQNASASPVNITVEIFAPGNSIPVATQTQNSVPANAAANFEQEGMAQLSNNVAYSAKITASGNIAPIVNIYGRGVADNQLYSYNPFSAGATKYFTPIVMNNYFGNNTSIAVQNIGASDADVEITYSTGQTVNFTVAPNSAASRYTPSEGVPSGNAQGLMGAIIESDQPVVVLVNMSNPFNRAASYSGFPSGSMRVRAPIVLKRYFNFNSSVVCQNVGALAATMTLTYGGVAGSDVSGSIVPGATHQFYQPASSLINNGHIGSATIQSVQPIVCVVNQDTNEGVYATMNWDQQYSYNGVND